MALNINGTTGISGVDGSVSAPALTGTDSNTGITFPSADTIKFSTGGVERLSITNSGLSGDGSGLSGISAGITMHDNWYIDSSLSPAGGTNFITANWARNTNTECGKIGSAMTESSGVFTFPSTGVYKIDFNGGYYVSSSGGFSYVGFAIHTTLDNANYSKRIESYQGVPARANNYVMCPVSYVFDVTSTTNNKIKLSTISDGSGGTIIDVGGRYGQVFFTRLGDT